MARNRAKFLAKLVITTFLLSTIIGINSSHAETLTACVNKKSGVMRMLVKGNCKSKSESKVTWNIQGEPGTPGVSGADGLPGASGASTTSLWFSPMDLLASRSGVNSDTSSLTSLGLTTNFLHAETLKLAMGKERVVLKAVPKGWDKATTLTIRVYWVTDVVSTAPVSFEVVVGSRGEGDDLTSIDWGTFAGTTSNATKGAKVMNVETLQWNSRSEVSDGDLLSLSLYRRSAQDLATSFTGEVYILGVSVQANFS